MNPCMFCPMKQKPAYSDLPEHCETCAWFVIIVENEHVERYCSVTNSIPQPHKCGKWAPNPRDAITLEVH